MFDPRNCPVGTLCVFSQTGTFRDVTCVWEVSPGRKLKEHYAYQRSKWIKPSYTWKISQINMHGKWKSITKEQLAFMLISDSQEV